MADTETSLLLGIVVAIAVLAYILSSASSVLPSSNLSGFDQINPDTNTSECNLNENSSVTDTFACGFDTVDNFTNAFSASTTFAVVSAVLGSLIAIALYILVKNIIIPLAAAVIPG